MCAEGDVPGATPDTTAVESMDEHEGEEQRAEGQKDSEREEGRKAREHTGGCTGSLG